MQRDLQKPIRVVYRTPGQPDRVETISTITLRAALAGDSRAMDNQGGENGATMGFIAQLSGVGVKQIEKLAVADYLALAAVLAPVLGEVDPSTVSNPLTLDHPVEVEGGEPIKAISIREMLAGDFRVSDTEDGENAATLAVIAHLSGLPIEVIDRVSFADYRRLSTVIGSFIQPGLPT